MQDTKGKVILSLLAGATAGIVAGLLLAPETGDETRAGLKKSTSKLGDDLGKLMKEGLARLNSLKDQAPASPQQQSDRSAADRLLDSLTTADGAVAQSGVSSKKADSEHPGTDNDAPQSAGHPPVL